MNPEKEKAPSMLQTPLRFTPLFRKYLWGGRRLQTSLGKSIGPEGNYAESWEIVDHGPDQSIVLAGKWAGQSLNEILMKEGEALLGRDFEQWSQTHQIQGLGKRFPLLFKFLDCHRPLSVQVHPNDAQASNLSCPDLGKTEAWVVLEAVPGTKVFAGLRSGIGKADLAKAVNAGRTEEMRHCFEPQAGDCIFIPAGTVHALGAGLVIAEIQQASDTTYRLFDWNRVDASGNSRPLHIAQSLEVIDETSGPVDPVAVTVEESGLETLVNCDKFVLRRRHLASHLTLGGDDRMRILVSVEGSCSLKDDPSGQPLKRGQTALLPAAAGDLALELETSTACLLEITLS